MENIDKYKLMEKLNTQGNLIGEKIDEKTFKCKINNNLIIKVGVTLKDIEKKLDSRSLKVTRRPGNAKDYRTIAAAKMSKSEKLQAAAANIVNATTNLPSPGSTSTTAALAQTMPPPPASATTTTATK